MTESRRCQFCDSLWGWEPCGDGFICSVCAGEYGEANVRCSYCGAGNGHVLQVEDDDGRDFGCRYVPEDAASDQDHVHTDACRMGAWACGPCFKRHLAGEDLYATVYQPRVGAIP